MDMHELTFEELVGAICQADDTLGAQATRAVNISLTLRNWMIGFYIAEFELRGADRATYGDNLLNELSRELRAKQVGATGRRQLYGYLAFYRVYPQIVRTLPALSAHLPSLPTLTKKVRTLSAQFAAESTERFFVDPARIVKCLSYSHLEQIVEHADALKRSFYELEAIRGNWSVRELKRQIATQLFERSGFSSHKEMLSALTHANAETQKTGHVIRDPYVFEFLRLNPREVMSEGHLEDALIDKLQEFLIELGHGFCFEARQKRLLIGGEYFFVDLVFYHRVLKCHVLIELKNDRFQHEHLSQLNTYVAYYKQQQMTAGDQPPIGILLCTHKNHELVEFALSDIPNNLFVSRYQVQLPNKEEIAAFLNRAIRELEAG